MRYKRKLGARKIDAWSAPISGGSVKDDKRNDVENENLGDKQNIKDKQTDFENKNIKEDSDSDEEPFEECSVEIKPQPADNDDACSKQSSEETDSQYDPSEDEEEEVEQTKETLDETSRPYTDNGYEKERSCSTINDEWRNQPGFVLNGSNEKHALVSTTVNASKQPTEETLDETPRPYADNGYEKENSHGTINDEMRNQPGVVSKGSNEKHTLVSTTENASTQPEQSEKQRRGRLDANPKCETASEQPEQPGSSGRRRVSRWASDEAPRSESENTSKRRKTRWAVDDSKLDTYQLPDFADWDPEIQVLKMKLLENEKQQREGGHDVKLLENLALDRQIIGERLLEKIALLREPTKSTGKPPRLCKKLYIPVKEYPDYNFVGLIIGPRGLTLKRMMAETGTEILLRGKNSSKKKVDPTDNDDLHVLITADNQTSLDDAVGRVEKLLIPVDEGTNEHKRAQLRELAELYSKDKANVCRTCGEAGHLDYSCSNRNSVLIANPKCDKCGGIGHFTAECPLKISTPGSVVDIPLSRDPGEAGGVMFGTPLIPSHVPWQASSAVVGISPSNASDSSSGPDAAPVVDDKSGKEVEVGRLFVSCLPPSADDNRLRELFAVYGRITEVSVIKDSTGRSKGYGFVKYDDPLNASVAAVQMNGYKIGGKTLLVELGGIPFTDMPASTSVSSSYQGSLMPQSSPSPASWPRPPVSQPVPSSSGPSSASWPRPPVSPQVPPSSSPSPASWPRPPVSPPVPPISSPNPVSWPRLPISSPVPPSNSPRPTSWPRPQVSPSVLPSSSPRPALWPRPPVSTPVPPSPASWPRPRPPISPSVLPSSSPSQASWPRPSVSPPVPPSSAPRPASGPRPPVSSPVPPSSGPRPASGPHPLVSSPVPPSSGPRPASGPCPPVPPNSGPRPASGPHPPVSSPVPPSNGLRPASGPRPPVYSPVPPISGPLPPYQGSPMMFQRSPSPASWARPPVSAPAPSTRPPQWYPDSMMVPQYNPSMMAWPGPPGSMLPDPQLSSTNSNSLDLGLHAIVSGQNDSSGKWLPSSQHISNASSDPFADFPGNPDRKSQHSSIFAPSSSASPQSHLAQTPKPPTSPLSWPPIRPS